MSIRECNKNVLVSEYIVSDMRRTSNEVKRCDVNKTKLTVVVMI